MKSLIGIILFFVTFTACKHNDRQITDRRDNSRYGVIEPGSYCWMSENLHYLDSNIYESGAWVWSSGELTYEQACEKAECGSAVLYSWQTAYEVCPDGWHLPCTTEWLDMISYYQETGKGTPCYRGFNLRFGGEARYIERFCLFDGDTFWTSDSLCDKNRAYVIVFNITDKGLIKNNIEKSDINNGYFVRCVKDHQ